MREPSLPLPRRRSPLKTRASRCAGLPEGPAVGCSSPHAPCAGAAGTCTDGPIVPAAADTSATVARGISHHS